MLELENITAGYGDTVVLRDVSLSVPDSKVVALLGPNGAGKTTLLRVASGLIKPMSGRVILNGEDVTGKKPFYMCRKGLCNGFVKRFCRNFKGVLVAVRVFARYRAGPQTQGDHLSRRTRISAISDPFTQ